jgi:hypothetical protein
MWNRIKRWWAAEGAMVSLQGLDDRLLADMGQDREGLRDRVMGQVDVGPLRDDCLPLCRAQALTARD